MEGGEDIVRDEREESIGVGSRSSCQKPRIQVIISHGEEDAKAGKPALYYPIF